MSTGRGDGLGRELALIAESYIGHPYIFGGIPGRNGNAPWDCSSSMNFIYGVDAGLDIPDFPAGTYDGTVHGPSTLGWLGWQGQGVGSIDRDTAQAGDIACWQTHMGMFINHDEMVSAQNRANGTKRSFVDGFIPNEQLVCLRLAVIGPGGITLPTPHFAGTAEMARLTRDIARSARDLVWIRMQIRGIARRPI